MKYYVQGDDGFNISSSITASTQQSGSFHENSSVSIDAVSIGSDLASACIQIAVEHIIGDFCASKIMQKVIHASFKAEDSAGGFDIIVKSEWESTAARGADAVRAGRWSEARQVLLRSFDLYRGLQQQQPPLL